MAPKTQKPVQAPITVNTQTTTTPTALPVLSASSQPGSANNRYGNTMQTPITKEPFMQTPTTYQPSGQSPASSQAAPMYSQQQPQQPPYSANTTPSRDAYVSPPYPTHSSGPTTAMPNSGIQSPSLASAGATAPPPARQFSNPSRPVFGVSLDELFNRDQSAVPMVVYQCMQAVDVFGLEAEGIYRVNGSASAVTALRNAFDTLPPSAPQLDFRNPANFYQDVNVVTTLLKTFFRDLPDPLFTQVGYGTFINAAKVENDDARRDALHQAINDLPDPNYATLRALVLHLHRVMLREEKTRMGSSNLAVCIAPSLMGMQNPANVGDAALQAKVVDSILMNATAIFDED